MPTDTSWGKIVAHNLSFFLGLVVLVLVLIAALYWFVTALPPADWSFSPSMRMPMEGMSPPRRP